MPRDVNGDYSLPPGNPVVAGTVIESPWANLTLADVAAELTNSLDRYGKGGMLVPFLFIDGTQGLPGLAFTNEITTGFRRAAPKDMRAVVGGKDVMRWIDGNVQTFKNGVWGNLLDQGYIDSQGFVTEAWVDAQGFTTEAWVTGQGYATEAWVNSQNFTTLAAVQSWVNGQGYATQAWVNSQNFTTLSAVQSWVTAQGYTTLSAVQSWVNAQSYTTLAAVQTWVGTQNFATQSWVTSQGFATQSWVTSQGYTTQAWVTSQGYATQSWVTSQGYVTQATIDGQGYAKLATAQSFTALQTFTASLRSPSISNAVANQGVTITGNRNAADAGADVTVDSAVNRTGGYLLEVKNAGVLKAYVGYLGQIYGASVITAGGGFSGNSLTATPTVSATINGYASDGASAVGVILNNMNTLATAGAKLASFRNNGTEKAYFDKDGTLVTSAHGYFGGTLYPSAQGVSAANVANGSLLLAGNRSAADSGADVILNSLATRSAGKLLSVQNNGVEKFYIDSTGALNATGSIMSNSDIWGLGIYGTKFQANGAVAASLIGQIADGSSAVGVILNNTTNLANASAKLVSIRNAGVEKAYFDKDGNLYSGGSLTATQAWITSQGFTTQSWVNSQGFATQSWVNSQGFVNTNTENFWWQKQHFEANLTTYAIDSGSSLTCTANPTDSASAYGYIFNTATYLTTAGAKIALFQNGYNTVASITKDGEIYAAQGEVIIGKDGGSNIVADVLTSKNPQAFQLTGQSPNAANAISVVVDSAETFTDPTAKILALRSGGFDKAYIDKDGSLGTLKVLTNAANSSLTLLGSRTAADAGAEVVTNSTVTRTAGKLVAFQNNGVEKLAVGFDGRLVGAAMDMLVFYAGKPGNAALMYKTLATSAFRLPASLAGSKFHMGTNPAATTVLTLKKNGTSIGTLSISTGGVYTPTGIAQTDFAVGDRFEITNQATADANAADFSIGLLASRL